MNTPEPNKLWKTIGTFVSVLMPFIICFFIWCSHLDARMAVIEATQIHKEELKEAVTDAIAPLVEDMKSKDRKDMEQDARLHDLEAKK